jgi:hypothetical protein
MTVFSLVLKCWLFAFGILLFRGLLGSPAIKGEGGLLIPIRNRHPPSPLLTGCGKRCLGLEKFER